MRVAEVCGASTGWKEIQIDWQRKPLKIEISTDGKKRSFEILIDDKKTHGVKFKDQGFRDPAGANTWSAGGKGEGRHCSVTYWSHRADKLIACTLQVGSQFPWPQAATPVRSDGSRRTWRLLLLLCCRCSLPFVHLSSTKAEGRVLVLPLISLEGSSVSTLHVDPVQREVVRGGGVEEVGVQWSGTAPAGVGVFSVEEDKRVIRWDIFAKG